MLPDVSYHTNQRLDNIPLSDKFILSLIRDLNANKSNGSSCKSPRMLLMHDENVVLPLQIIFSNILPTSVYLGLWKHANLTPIFKKK